MEFIVNWSIQGQQKLGSTSVPNRRTSQELSQGQQNSFEPGDIIEAKIREVEDFVARKYGGKVVITANAALTPLGVTPIPVKIPGHEVDLDKLNADGLAAHARKYHAMGLGNQHEPRKVMLERIRDARAEQTRVQN